LTTDSHLAGGEVGANRTREGLLAGLVAYVLWGFLPIYFKIVETVPPLEVLAHRIVWAVPFGLPIILARRQWGEVRRTLADRRKLALLGLSATLIAVNWLVYIWAVQQEQIFQASLGYYINPLMYVLVGVVFFREHLRPPQVAAVVLAGAGVAVLTLSGGTFPAIALTLATSFTIYGVIRSRVAVGGMPGLFIETLILFPAAAAYAARLAAADAAVFGPDDPALAGLLVLGAVHGLAAVGFCARRAAPAVVDDRGHAVHCADDAVRRGLGIRRDPDGGACRVLYVDLGCRRGVQRRCLAGVSGGARR